MTDCGHRLRHEHAPEAFRAGIVARWLQPNEVVAESDSVVSADRQHPRRGCVLLPGESVIDVPRMITPRMTRGAPVQEYHVATDAMPVLRLTRPLLPKRRVLGAARLATAASRLSARGAALAGKRHSHRDHEGNRSDRAKPTRHAVLLPARCGHQRSHVACTRNDTLFDVPPSGGRLNTVIFTVRSPYTPLS